MRISDILGEDYQPYPEPEKSPLGNSPATEHEPAAEEELPDIRASDRVEFRWDRASEVQRRTLNTNELGVGIGRVERVFPAAPGVNDTPNPPLARVVWENGKEGIHAITQLRLADFPDTRRNPI